MAALMQSLATTNLGYLGLCVTILLFAGGFFYLFNFKPLQDTIKKQEDELKAITKEINEKLESLSENFQGLVKNQAKELGDSIAKAEAGIEEIKNEGLENIKKAEDKIAEIKANAESELLKLRKALHETELITIWNEQYMWDAKHVMINVVATLIEYFEKHAEYEGPDYMVKIWLNRVEAILDRAPTEKIIGGKDKLARLLEILALVKGHDEQVKKAVEKAPLVLVD